MHPCPDVFPARRGFFRGEKKQSRGSAVQEEESWGQLKA